VPLAGMPARVSAELPTRLPPRKTDGLASGKAFQPVCQPRCLECPWLLPCRPDLRGRLTRPGDLAREQARLSVPPSIVLGTRPCPPEPNIDQTNRYSRNAKPNSGLFDAN